MYINSIQLKRMKLNEFNSALSLGLMQECFDNAGCEIELNGMADMAVSVPDELTDVKEMKDLKKEKEDPWAILDIPHEETISWSGTSST